MMCPNGCGKLEREDHEDGHDPNALYWCDTCDYQAIWRLRKRRHESAWAVVFPGIGRPYLEPGMLYQMGPPGGPSKHLVAAAAI